MAPNYMDRHGLRPRDDEGVPRPRDDRNCRHCERSAAIHGFNYMDRHGLRPRDDEGVPRPRDDEPLSLSGASLRLHKS